MNDKDEIIFELFTALGLATSALATVRTALKRGTDPATVADVADEWFREARGVMRRHEAAVIGGNP